MELFVDADIKLSVLVPDTVPYGILSEEHGYFAGFAIGLGDAPDNLRECTDFVEASIDLYDETEVASWSFGHSRNEFSGHQLLHGARVVLLVCLCVGLW